MTPEDKRALAIMLAGPVLLVGAGLFLLQGESPVPARTQPEGPLVSVNGVLGLAVAFLFSCALARGFRRGPR